MDDSTQEFIEWLKGDLGVESEEDLKKKLTDLGEAGILEKHKQFKASKKSMAKGGKFNYINCLQQFKKGGKMSDDCGCKPKKEIGGKLSNVIHKELSGSKTITNQYK